MLPSPPDTVTSRVTELSRLVLLCSKLRTAALHERAGRALAAGITDPSVISAMREGTL